MRSRQRLLAATLPVSAALLCAGSATTPKGLDQLITSTATAARVLPVAPAHTSPLSVSNLLLLFGLGVLGVSYSAMATLVRARGARLATAAAVIGGIGCLSGALGNVLAGFNLAAAVKAQLPTADAERYLVTTFTSTAGELLLGLYLTGMLVGAILMAVALGRSCRVPRWLPVLFVLGLATAAFSPVGLVAIPLQLPFAVAMVLLGSRVWRETG